MDLLDLFSDYGIQALRILIINKLLKECIIPGYDIYIYDDIPYSLYLNAKYSYAYEVDYDDVIAMADTTVLGSFKRGLLFTKEGVYYKDILNPVEYGEYGNLSVFDNMYTSTFYYSNEVERLFNWLNNLQYMSYAADGVRMVGKWLNLSDEELEGVIDELFDDTIIPAIEESARLMEQEVAYDLMAYIKSLLEI